MKNNKTTIKGTGIICKGNLKASEFELFPNMLFDYLQLELIKPVDVVVYEKLLQLYNDDYGYAYPTVSQLMKYINVKGKATIDNSLDRLEEVGLIKRGTANRGNNVYVVYKPFSQEELYRLFPDNVEKLKDFKNRLKITDKRDKERLSQHNTNKQLQEEREQQIKAKQIVPNLDNMENLSLKEVKRRMIDSGKWKGSW